MSAATDRSRTWRNAIYGVVIVVGFLAVGWTFWSMIGSGPQREMTPEEFRAAFEEADARERAALEAAKRERPNL